tara:strand:+ start:2536 stop:2823 length:288 start_codon:yes stop_codon:yes gene_type:complete
VVEKEWCKENHICFSEQEWSLFIREYELDLQQEFSENTDVISELSGDGQAIADFTWQVLFLSPWELAYIALPMSVLAFYGLSIYALFKWLQKRFS